MIRRLLAWCQAHHASAWVTEGVFVVLALGLAVAVGWTLATMWERHIVMRERAAEVHGAREMMVLSNQICEARLDRMQGIYRDFLLRHSLLMERVPEPDAPTPPLPGEPAP
jgi:hypothetical protein